MSLDMLPKTGCIEIIFPVIWNNFLADEWTKLVKISSIELVSDSIRLVGR